jgi:hypothetical protein
VKGKMSGNNELERGIKALSDEGISCTVDGDNIVCTADVLKPASHKIEIPKKDFSVEKVRKQFDEL